MHFSVKKHKKFSIFTGHPSSGNNILTAKEFLKADTLPQSKRCHANSAMQVTKSKLLAIIWFDINSLNIVRPQNIVLTFERQHAFLLNFDKTGLTCIVHCHCRVSVFCFSIMTEIWFPPLGGDTHRKHDVQSNGRFRFPRMYLFL